MYTGLFYLITYSCMKKGLEQHYAGATLCRTNIMQDQRTPKHNSRSSHSRSPHPLHTHTSLTARDAGTSLAATFYTPTSPHQHLDPSSICWQLTTEANSHIVLGAARCFTEGPRTSRLMALAWVRLFLMGSAQAVILGRRARSPGACKRYVLARRKCSSFQ